jgi:dipeptidyl aminopeptidase/acylaminoacyl peptidase
MVAAAARGLLSVAGVAFLALAAATPAEAAFPGRNGAIAFARSSGSGDFDPQLREQRALIAMAPGSTRQRVLVRCELTDGVPSGGDCTAPSFAAPSYSPRGGRIVFDAGERLGLIDADGGSLTLLPAASANDGSPAFSPDGRRIVFAGANDRGTTDLYIRRLDGGAARPIVYDAGEPAWSSHNVVAYLRSGNVYVARPGGRHRRFVTSGVSPDWSPDGRRLALVRPSPRLTFDAPIGGIYLVSPTGRRLRRVRGVGAASFPAWSPNGRSLTYQRFDSGIFLKRLGRRGERLLVEDQFSGENGFISSFQPAWRPLPPSRR